jgi:hypothetical protein
MKDQYFGDVNDYRKYGLLRAMAAAGLSIGVCWLLTGDDQGSDGELRRYLTKPARWRGYDPELYDRLQGVGQPDCQRGVRCCSLWGLVPGAAYFDEILRDNSRQRDAYFRKAFGALAGCDVIFFDPDNGIEVSSTGRGKRGSSKYIYWTELRAAYGKSHSLLVYQQFPRVERTRFVPFLADRLGEELRAMRVQAFTTPHVAFFLAHQAVHSAALENVAARVLATWPGQIDVWPGIRAAV